MPTHKQIVTNAACCLADLLIGRWSNARFHARGIKRAVAEWCKWNDDEPSDFWYWTALTLCAASALSLFLVVVL